jgi:hypothetical protein
MVVSEFCSIGFVTIPILALSADLILPAEWSTVEDAIVDPHGLPPNLRRLVENGVIIAHFVECDPVKIEISVPIDHDYHGVLGQARLKDLVDILRMAVNARGHPVLSPQVCFISLKFLK